MIGYSLVVVVFTKQQPAWRLDGFSKMMVWSLIYTRIIYPRYHKVLDVYSFAGTGSHCWGSCSWTRLGALVERRSLVSSLSNSKRTRVMLFSLDVSLSILPSGQVNFVLARPVSIIYWLLTWKSALRVWNGWGNQGKTVRFSQYAMKLIGLMVMSLPTDRPWAVLRPWENQQWMNTASSQNSFES